MSLWPGAAPGVTGKEPKERDLDGPKPIPHVTQVSKPTLALYRPPAQKANGAAVVVCPGGGYNFLAIDHEGMRVAAWLNTLGVAAALLKYRVPPAKGEPRHRAPLQDAQRAVSLVRHNAKRWKIDPGRIGILGFSAGGHLAAAAVAARGKRRYRKRDAADAAGCRPDFAVLIYPAYLAGKGKSAALSPEVAVTPESCPAFLAVAADDRGPAEGSLRYALALQRAGVSAETHVCESGGHGFGITKSPSVIAQTWTARCAEWMKARGLLERRSPRRRS
jgi:acetyl esterase/lipase